MNKGFLKSKSQNILIKEKTITDFIINSMPKPMTIILIGSIISICGGLIVAYGTYKQHIASSKKSDSILLKTSEGIEIGNFTQERVIEIYNQNKELKIQAVNLSNGQENLNKKLEPFIEYAQQKFPHLEANEALAKLEELLQQQTLRLDETNIKVSKIKEDFANEKEHDAPKITYASGTLQNRKITSIENQFDIENDDLTIDIKKAYNVNYLYENQIEFYFETRKNIREFNCLLRNDIFEFTIFMQQGIMQPGKIASNNGQIGFKLLSPTTGVYVINLYSKRPLNNLKDILIPIN